MRKVLNIWLPPEGDHRLLHFQQDLGRQWKDPAFQVIFPYLSGDPGAEWPPSILEVELKGWKRNSEGLFLETNVPGWLFRMAFPLAVPETALDPARLPPPPVQGWTRGRLGLLELETSDESWSQVIWKLTRVRPWRPPLISQEHKG